MLDVLPCVLIVVTGLRWKVLVLTRDLSPFLQRREAEDLGLQLIFISKLACGAASLVVKRDGKFELLADHARGMAFELVDRRRVAAIGDV